MMKTDIFHRIKAAICYKQLWCFDYTDEIPMYDVKKSKISAVLAYLFFFIPLIFHDDQQFARFHSNQALLNTLLSTIVATIVSLIPYVGLLMLLIVELLCLFNAIRGMILAACGKAVGIPFVGRITLLSYRRT